MAQGRSETLSRSRRLRTKREYERVYAARCRYKLDGLVVHFAAGAGSSRIGLAISRRVGGAVVRNRIRRRLRELFRRSADLRDRGVDIVFQSAGSGDIGEASLLRSFEEAERRIIRRFQPVAR